MEANCSGASKSTNCRGTNVYVNCCCPDDGDGGSQSGFKGTNVYVDSKNESATADGTINNPFKTVLDAFKYVDSSDENYIIHIISISADEHNIDYTFSRKGRLGITGAWANINQTPIGGYFTLRMSAESHLSIKGMSIGTLDVYGAETLILDDLLSPYVNLYDIKNEILVNNCRFHASPTTLALRYEEKLGLLPNLSINNSSIKLILNNAVYYSNIYNSYVSEITTGLEDESGLLTLIQLTTQGCVIGKIDNIRALKSSTFNLYSTLVSEITDMSEETRYRINISGAGFYTETAFTPINYSPESRSLTANLEAIDKKLGELEARLGA